MKFPVACLLAIAAALSSPAAAQTVAPIDASAIEEATPAMWRVRDADSDYILLGTFHILPPALNWRNPAIEAAFADADAVYFELDANAPDASAKAVNAMMLQGFNPPGVTLSSLLDPQDALKLQAVVKELKLPFAAVDTMRPWNAFLTLSVQFIINQGFDPGAGVDSILLKEAKADGKDVRFFESIEQQLAIFTGLDEKTAKELLTVTLRDWDEQAATFDDLFYAWARGDDAYLDQEMNEIMDEQAPEVFDKLIVARNKAWAEELDAALKTESGSGLVAVGAAHLVGGEFSLPALLAAKGYEVTRYGADGTVETVAAPVPANDNDE